MKTRKHQKLHQLFGFRKFYRSKVMTEKKYCSDQELAALKMKIQNSYDEIDYEITMERKVLEMVSCSAARQRFWLSQVLGLLEKQPVTIDMANQIKKGLDNIYSIGLMIFVPGVSATGVVGFDTKDTEKVDLEWPWPDATSCPRP